MLKAQQMKQQQNLILMGPAPTMANKKQRELYVGNLAQGMATVPNVQEFFTSLFMAIPAYQERYIGTIPQPVLSVSLSGDGTYAFVEFATEELCSTALEFD